MVKENAKFFKVVMPEQKQGEAVMSKGQSEREYLDETYNRGNCKTLCCRQPERHCRLMHTHHINRV